MRYFLIVFTLPFIGCSFNSQITIRGQYADTRIFVNEGEIGVAIRPNFVRIELSQVRENWK